MPLELVPLLENEKIFNITGESNITSFFGAKNSEIFRNDKVCEMRIKDIIISIIYTFGIVGNLCALVHLCRRRSFRNVRHSYMLKCLISNNLVGLIGMIAQMHITHYLPYGLRKNPEVMRLLCMGRVFCRVFGLNSGCVAFVMACERWLALTKPFTYQQLVTKTRIGYTIFSLWIISTFWTCLPLMGFGLYYSRQPSFKCVRYRQATDIQDIVYAYSMFVLGMLLCIGIVIFNLTVSKVLYKVHFSRRGSTSSLHHCSTMNVKNVTRTLFQITSKPSFFQTAPSSEEIRFAKLMLILSFSFLICWAPQMATIVLFQRLKPDNKFAHIFAVTADILMLFHFVADPYIYVLLRSHRRKMKAHKTYTLRRVFSTSPRHIPSSYNVHTYRHPNACYQAPVNSTVSTNECNAAAEQTSWSATIESVSPNNASSKLQF